MSIKLVNFSKKFITKKYLSWMNDKYLTKYSRHRFKKITKNDALNYLKEMRNNLFYAIVKNSNHIGNIAAYIDHPNKIADISIILADQGKGYGLISWKEISKKLKANKIRKITASTMIINKPMIKLFKKNGMKFEYKKKKHFLYKKKYIDLVGYSKFL